MRPSSCPARSIRPSFKPSSARSPTSNPAWTLPVGEIFFGTAIYVIVTVLLAAAQAVAIVVIAYGFIATAVCVLVGPIFVPFFIVPKLEWLFWGWLRCFLQYAFYQVIASAVVLRHRKSHAWSAPPAACRHPLDRATHCLVSRPLHHLPCLHLRPPENPDPDQPHLQRHRRRLFRKPSGCARRRSQSGDVMDRDASFHDAKRLYLESCGDPMVTNTYLKIALVLVSPCGRWLLLLWT